MRTCSSPLHDLRPGVRADRRRGETGCQQADREQGRDDRSEGGSDRGVSALEGVGALDPLQRGGGQEQDHDVDRAGDRERDGHVDAGRAQHTAALAPLLHLAEPVARERRVRVDRVRHDRGAHDGCREQHRPRVGEARHESGDRGGRVERCEEDARAEPDRDDRDQADDHDLERPRAAPAVQQEEQHRDGARDQAADEQRQIEQQVERDRAAEHLGDVGGHGDELGLHPVGVAGTAALDARGRGRPGRLSPVLSPSLADRYWMSHAIEFATTTTQTSR